MKAWEMLSDESKWTQGSFYKDANGEYDTNEEPVCWCVLGAISHCYAFDDFALMLEVEDRLRAAVDCAPEDWNDAPERTFAEVHAVLKELDI